MSGWDGPTRSLTFLTASNDTLFNAPATPPCNADISTRPVIANITNASIDPSANPRSTARPAVPTTVSAASEPAGTRRIRSTAGPANRRTPPRPLAYTCSNNTSHAADFAASAVAARSHPR
ncbi:hypothetical protein Vqi01_15410 [Micromonospora qiuiae]|uniref:Uncharacterized protein n=1 Tax=Micromonospora qiuiae TaxID=502268 RepID=A0ABQ4J884_9ACTN|nr:hypothetical protein Vqi01_15410 [Micromonospora qiuiae]